MMHEVVGQNGGVFTFATEYSETLSFSFHIQKYHNNKNLLISL